MTVRTRCSWRAVVGALAALPVQPALAQPLAASAHEPLNPRATELFMCDPELGRWALRLYDSNRDGWLTLYEAQPALAAFRDIADADRDGRVTVREYSQAKAFIEVRY